MKKLIAGILALTLTCGTAALPAVESGLSLSSITASAADYTSALSLTSDMTISGDMNISADLNLNGYTLTVTGDMRMTSGTLKLSGGTLNVKGSLYFQTTSTVEGADLSVKTIINMSNANDAINVDGDFVTDIDNDVSTASTYSNGVITVKGDFIDNASASMSAFRASGSNKVVLSGTGNQTISLGGFSWFNQFEATNATSGRIIGQNYLHINEIDCDLTVTADDLALTGIYANGNNVVINGDVIQDGVIDLDGGTLTVNGNLTANNGKTNINGGTLNVNGDYCLRVEKVSSSGTVTYSNSTSYIYMTNDSDTVNVTGDFYNKGTSDFASKYTNGVMTVGGDFTDASTVSSASFKASSSHTLVLNGSGSQTVTSNSYTTFNQLEIKNPSSREITCVKRLYVNTLLSDAVIVPSSLTISKLSPNGNTVTFKGDVTLSCALNLADSKVTVTGDVTHTSSALTLAGGELVIGGDYKLQSASGSTCSATVVMSNANDVFTVGGDFVTMSTGTNTYTNGVLTVGGDFTDSSSKYFIASGSHKTILNGTSSQTVTMDNGNFNILELTKQLSSYTFSTDNCWNELILPTESGIDVSTDCTLTLSSNSATYTGAAIKPTVTVKYGTKTLTQGTDYTVSYSNNVNAGTASVTVTGIGSYEGTLTKSFTIYKKSLSYCTVSLAANQYTFNGKEITPAVTVKAGSNTISSSNYTVTYANNIKAGTATVTITGKNNLSGSVSKTFTIVQKSLSYCTVSLPSQYTFTGAQITPDVTVKIGDIKIYSGNYTVSCTNNIKAGTATVTITGKNNLKGTVTKTFKIVPKSLSYCTVSLSSNSANKYQPAVTVKIGDIKVYSGNYDVSYVTSSDAKTVTVTVTGKNNLTGSLTLTYTV